jgi:Protein of unknown function (DUF3638)/Protein of unknown function (DUF3645)
LQLRGRTDSEKFKTLKLLLSFMMWKNVSWKEPSMALMEVTQSNRQSVNIADFQLPLTATQCGSWYLSDGAIQSLLESTRHLSQYAIDDFLQSVEHLSEYEVEVLLTSADLPDSQVKKLIRAPLWSDGKLVKVMESARQYSRYFYLFTARGRQAMSQVFQTIVSRVKNMQIWTSEGGNVVATNVKAPNPFSAICEGLEAAKYIKTASFIQSMTGLYHLLFYRKQIHLFTVAIDAAIKNVRMPDSCFRNCPHQLSMKWKQLTASGAVPRFALKSHPHVSLPVVTSGSCVSFEEEFQKCLRIESSSGQNVDFPLNLTATDQEPVARELVSKLKKSWKQFQDFKLKNGVPRVHGDVPTIRQMLRSIEHKIQQTVSNSWAELQRCLEPAADDWVNRCRRASGLLSFESPRTLFARYCRTQSHLAAEIREQVGRHLIYLVYLQKATRCLEMVDTWESTLEDQRRHFGQRLIREIGEPHCVDWSPEDHPKWLIFEVENNVLIRRIQAQVALKIIRGEEQILQLNMGEGKTSVISPLVCSSLADGKHVVQLTLLTSLLETHGQELALKLSGLLEQTVHYFPCRRDIRFTKDLIDRMIVSFRECVRQRGCIVTVPEFRLSLLLKSEEMIIHRVNHYNGQMPPEVKSLLKLFGLHQSHLIDLVDEADEILRHKYQLLYTMGSQVSIDGGERRWQVLQDLLQVLFPQTQTNEESCDIPSELARLELNEEENEWKLITRVIGEVLSGRISGLAYFALLTSNFKETIRKYLTNELQSADLDELKSQLTDLQLQDLLILRGLLSYGVLPHALKKRWSVDYGVDVISKRRLMAVPFRGKDTPMPRTEFGHPDVFGADTHVLLPHRTRQEASDGCVD